VRGRQLCLWSKAQAKSAKTGEETLEKNKTLGFSDSGGASGSQPQSVPQLDPIFSYPTEGGDVLVYVVKAGFAVFTFVTFDDNYSEYAYAIETLVPKPALVEKPLISPTKVVWDLLEQAEKAFYNPFIQNPFSKLLQDHEARTKLIVTLRNFLSGE